MPEPTLVLAAAAQPWITAPASGNAELISQLFWFMLVLAAIVFFLVEALLLYSSFRFRRRTPLPLAEPPQIHGNTRLEVMWAAVPALLLVSLFVMSARTMGALSDFPQDGLHVNVVGQQFQWNFTYPDDGVTTQDDLRIPVGTPVILDVTSRDVIHSFWVPDLHGKIDANPGRTNRIWFQAAAPGTFRGVCAELCGSGHAGMLFKVEAMEPAAFQTWLEQQKGGAGATTAAAAGGGSADAGKTLIGQKGCGGCHTIPGVAGANGNVGPSLAGVASRKSIAGGAVPNNGPDDLKKWIMNPPALKPGTLMPNLGLSDAEATNIVAFLETLK